MLSFFAEYLQCIQIRCFNAGFSAGGYGLDVPESGLATPALCHKGCVRNMSGTPARAWEEGADPKGVRVRLDPAGGCRGPGYRWCCVPWGLGQAIPLLPDAVTPLGSGGLQGRGWPSTAPFSPSLRSHVCHHHTAYVQGRVQLKRLGNTALLKAKCPQISRDDKQSGWLHFFLPTARGYLRPHSAMLVGDRDQSCFLIVFIQWNKNAPDCSL